MKKELQKNSFEELCDKLEIEYEHNENEITYVKSFVEKEIGNDIDMLLKVQAEAQADDIWQYDTTRIAILAMFFSAFSVLIDFFPNFDNIWFGLIFDSIYLVIIIYVLIRIGLSRRYNSVRKWRKYVLVVVQEKVDNLKK